MWAGLVSVVLFLFLINKKSVSICPCSNLESESSLHTPPSRPTLCLINYISNASKGSLDLIYINVIFLDSDNQTSWERCDAVAVFRQHPVNIRKFCPGVCRPKPFIEIPTSWIHQLPKENELISCTSAGIIYDQTIPLNLAINISNNHLKTSGYIKNISSSNDRKLTGLSEILLQLFYRRIQECYEVNKWNSIVPSQFKTNRRNIQTLIIWIGTASNRWLLELQHSLLYNFSFIGESSVIGWEATDEVYSCLPNSTLCKANERDQYMIHMPTTGLGRIGLRSFGWGCAQRRPLRALAHCLSLFNPKLLIVADDDTYVNYPLLHPNIHFHIAYLSRQPMVLGRLTSIRLISSDGFFIGGGGYFFGETVINRLVANTVLDPRRSRDRFTHELSILKAARMAANKPDCLINITSSSSTSTSSMNSTSSHTTPSPSLSACTFGSTGGLSTSNNNGIDFVSIPLRLIDLCVNLLAPEHTCHHSDHSMTRCLLHGAGAIPVQMPCEAYDPARPGQISELEPHMCALGKEACNVRLHLTCHKFRPYSLDDPRPVENIRPQYSSG